MNWVSDVIAEGLVPVRVEVVGNGGDLSCGVGPAVRQSEELAAIAEEVPTVRQEVDFYK
jgi:hypothetical protein